MGVRGLARRARPRRPARRSGAPTAPAPTPTCASGPSFKAFYPEDRAKDLGVTTWPPDQWKIGGGTTWGWVTYDPGLHLLYYGTANPGVWNPDMRPGDNKWSMTIFARDPDTGEAKWAYQTDAARPLGLRRRSTRTSWPTSRSTGSRGRWCVHFDRNGFAYTMDRITGEVLVAQPYQFLNWCDRRGPQDRRARSRSRASSTNETTNTTDICPSSTGASDQQPAAFSPRTGLSTRRRPICAWTTRAWRRATSPARRTSAPR